MKNINLLLPNPLLIYHEKFSPRIAVPVELGGISDIDLGVEGRAIDKLQASADRLLVNIFADMAYELLPAWERVLGLTPDQAASTGVRVAAVVAKIRAKGGLSRPFFINLAAAMGYAKYLSQQNSWPDGPLPVSPWRMKILSMSGSLIS